jgi:hypothetical protein
VKAIEHDIIKKIAECRYAAREFVKRGVGKDELAIVTDEPVRHLSLL